MTYKLALNQYADFDDYISALNEHGFRDNELNTNNPVVKNEDGEITAIKTWHNGDGGVACVIDVIVWRDGVICLSEFYTYKGKTNDHKTIKAKTDYTPYINELVENGIIEGEKV